MLPLPWLDAAITAARLAGRDFDARPVSSVEAMLLAKWQREGMSATRAGWRLAPTRRARTTGETGDAA